MKKFEISKNTFEGKVLLVFDENEMLQLIDFSECKMDARGRLGFKNNAPIFLNELEAFSRQTQCAIRETDFVITFEMWYNDYGLKRNKAEAEILWKKMQSEEQLKCWVSNKAYKKYCSRNISWYNKMYPDTYLRKKHYMDEWDKI